MKNGEYILTPMISAGLFGADPRVWWFIGGIVAWTFVEYATHRALHVLRSREHHRHHAHPEDLPAVFWPFWIALVVGLVVAPLALLGGLVAGYSWFIHVHRDCHHAPNAVAPSLLAHHDGHHHAHPNSNFGVTTRFWDVLLGTAK